MEPSIGLATPTLAEAEATASGVGWFEDRRERLDLAGPDRVRFLQNLATCDVAGLAVDGSCRGFLTHVKGGVLADFDLVALADRLRLVLPPRRSEEIVGHLSKYRIIERVEIEPRTDLAAIGLRGARAVELIARLGWTEPGSGERREVRLDELPVGLRREPRGGSPRFEIEFPAPDRDPVVARLGSAGDRLGLVELSAAALELARIDAGELAWGVDYGEENFPQETGEDEAVSYTKGCYLGQEVVARIHYRGGVQRQPCRLRFETAAPEQVPAELLFEGRPAGSVTTAALDPVTGLRFGVGLVHRRAAAPGTRLEVAGGGTAVVESRD